MHRRHFIKSIAVTGFANLFLPKAMDRYKWFQTGRIIDPTPVFKAPDYQGKWVFVVEKFPLRFELDGNVWRVTEPCGDRQSGQVSRFQARSLVVLHPKSESREQLKCGGLRHPVISHNVENITK